MKKINYSQVDFDTMVIHAGQKPDPSTGALSTPIFQTSTFVFDNVEQGAARFAKEEAGYVYSRGGNPTTAQLEEKMAVIEGGQACVAAASGMGAIGSTLVSLLKSGDHIICGDTIYGGTSVLMHQGLPEMGIEVSFVDTTDLENVRTAIKSTTKVIYFETPTNPTMKVTDIKACADIAHEHNLLLVVDNTFAPPPIQYPLKLGADICIHSVTKYINGHGDVIGGVVIGPQDIIDKIRGLGITKVCGTPPSPFNSWLVLRGLKTLGMRVRTHCENALELAKFLESHEYVAKVFYPGLASHPQHEICKNQMNGLFGGMLSFELKEGINGKSAFEAGKILLNNLAICSIAVSLGDADTLIEHPASMTHASVDPEERISVGITDGLIRVSVGLENAKDIIEDLKQGFKEL